MLTASIRCANLVQHGSSRIFENQVMPRRMTLGKWAVDVLEYAVTSDQSLQSFE